MPAAEEFLVGQNPAPLTDWLNARPFADAFKQFRCWSRPGVTGGVDPSIPLSPAGYPLQDAGAYWSASGWPDGVYQFSWAGSGTPEWGGPGWVSGVNVLNLRPSQGPVWLTLTGVKADDPPHDFSLTTSAVPSWDYGSPPFTHDFVASLRPFGVLRFMDWALTNQTTPHPWSARRPASGPQASLLQSGDRGVAWEWVFRLCNAAGAHCWLCLPDWADADYATNLGALARAELAPHLRVYLAYSNEVWNPGFPQFGRVLQAAKDNPALTADNVYERLYQQVGFKLNELTGAFRGGFGVGESLGRVVPVLEGQAAVTWHAENALAWFKSNGIAVDSLLLAHDDYFPRWGLPLRTDPADAFWADVTAAQDANDKTLADWSALSSEYGCAGVVVYEGGQHLVDTGNRMVMWGTEMTGRAARHALEIQKAGAEPWWTPGDLLRADRYGAVPLNDASGRPLIGAGTQSLDHGLKLAAQDDPRMGALYARRLGAARKAGYRAWCHYNSENAWDGRYGYWGSAPGLGVKCVKQTALLAAAAPARRTGILVSTRGAETRLNWGDDEVTVRDLYSDGTEREVTG
jgi:hypothetical protein